MSEQSLPEERTEAPTDRRMGQLRREGALFVSQDTVVVASLLTGFTALGVMWPFLVKDLKLTFLKSIELMSRTEPFTLEELRSGFIGLTLLVAPHVLAITAAVAAVASLVVMLQTNWNIKDKKIHFNLPMLNPWNGIRRIFSISGFITTAKALLKLFIIFPIAMLYLRDFAPEMVKLLHLSIPQVMSFAGSSISDLFWNIWWVLLGFAIFDYLWGNYKWMRDNKMTKPEVKDERKAVEGDEATKRRIVAKGLQRMATRIRTSVPKAHVIVTNPTHISVALRYDRDNMAAPVVVAKGKGFIAMKIREIAREHNIPILERKPLARALFESTEVGASIPRDLFRAVAEVFAYVYRLKNPQRATAGADAR